MLFNNNCIQKSPSSGWGEKTKLSREFLSNVFSMKTIETTLFTFYCFWLTHDLLHVFFLIVGSYSIKSFLFPNYLMSFNFLRHMMKFRNSAALRLRILPLLHLDYFCKKIHSCVGFTKAEKEESSPVERDWIRRRKWTKLQYR